MIISYLSSVYLANNNIIKMFNSFFLLPTLHYLVRLYKKLEKNKDGAIENGEIESVVRHWSVSGYVWRLKQCTSSVTEVGFSLHCNPNLSFSSKSHALFFLTVNHRFQFLNMHYGHCFVPRFLVLGPIRVRKLLNNVRLGTIHWYSRSHDHFDNNFFMSSCGFGFCHCRRKHI